MRGATVDVDIRRAGRAVLALLVLGVLATAVLLFASGARKNTEITALHQRGVPVTLTVDDCRGLLGGSGSNAAGYSCWGSFTEAGRRYTETIPGTTLYTPGSTLRVVTVADDPGLLTTPGLLRHEQASLRVFLLPSALVAATTIVLAVLGLRRRSRQRASRSLPSRLALVGGGRLGGAAGGV